MPEPRRQTAMGPLVQSANCCGRRELNWSTCRIVNKARESGVACQVTCLLWVGSRPGGPPQSVNRADGGSVQKHGC